MRVKAEIQSIPRSAGRGEPNPPAPDGECNRNDYIDKTPANAASTNEQGKGDRPQEIELLFHCQRPRVGHVVEAPISECRPPIAHIAEHNQRFEEGVPKRTDKG